jgi:hypothetical protein
MEQKLIPITELVGDINNKLVKRKGYYDASIIWRFREIEIDNYDNNPATLIVPTGDAEHTVIIVESLEELRNLMEQVNIMKIRHTNEKNKGNDKFNGSDWGNS